MCVVVTPYVVETISQSAKIISASPVGPPQLAASFIKGLMSDILVLFDIAPATHLLAIDPRFVKLTNLQLRNRNTKCPADTTSPDIKSSVMTNASASLSTSNRSECLA